MGTTKAGGKHAANLGAERREQERFQCTGFAEVVVEDAAFLFRGSIRDISLNGCYIQSSARLKLARGTTVELRFSAIGSDELTLPARIMIIRPRAGAGFEFVNVDRQKLLRIATLIRKLANPGNADPPAKANCALANATQASSTELWRRR